jgi:hypothetical protein
VHVSAALSLGVVWAAKLDKDYLELIISTYIIVNVSAGRWGGTYLSTIPSQSCNGKVHAYLKKYGQLQHSCTTHDHCSIIRNYI